MPPIVVIAERKGCVFAVSYLPSEKAVLFRQTLKAFCGYAAVPDGGIAAGIFIRASRKSIAFPLGETEIENVIARRLPHGTEKIDTSRSAAAHAVFLKRYILRPGFIPSTRPSDSEMP